MAARLLRHFAALVVAMAALLSAKTARALGPVDVEAAALAGYGTNPVRGYAINPLGLGIGGRAGVSAHGFYGGVSVVDYLGGTNGSTRSASVEMGVEAGYGIRVSLLTIRPELGIGDLAVRTSIPDLGAATQNSLYLEPRVTAVLTFGVLCLATDVGTLVLTHGPTVSGTGLEAAVTFHAQVGVTF
jgi:hypothetical protein